MLLEIESQASGWAQAIALMTEADEVLKTVLGGKQARFLGAGSSYYLGNAASSAWLELGLQASSVPASEPLLHPKRYPWTPGHVAIAASRSGTTTETLEALKRAKAAGASAITITTAKDSPMERLSDLTFVLSEGAEKATVQTRSFSSQLMTALSMAVHLTNPEELGRLEAWLPKAPELISNSAQVVAQVGMEWDRAFFLGTGTLVGIAQEGALKMKETALTEAEPFQTLEFRHGPKSMVDDRTLVVGLISEEAAEQELKVLIEAQSLGARLLLIGASLPTVPGATQLNIGTAVPSSINAPLMLPTLQQLAYQRAMAKGISPEHPRNLSFAVQLDGF